MHIISLEAQNVKRLEAVRIEPSGNMVAIGGANGAGKSSALDCIEMVLGGKKHLCDVPLRSGTESGRIGTRDREVYRRAHVHTEGQLYHCPHEGGLHNQQPAGPPERARRRPLFRPT